jgi:predicted DNA-binding protein
MKKKIEIFVTEEMKKRLKEKADFLGIGMATVLKIALEEYLKK